LAVTGAAPTSRVFRLPALAYLVVLFLLFGTVPVALTTTGEYNAPAQISIRTVALVIPLLAAIFIARTATIVNSAGITVRAAFGSRRLPWEQIRGLSIDGNTVYAVLADGLVRLPCVRIAHLAELARASGGRLPQLRDPQPKFAPARRRRR
jgi:hypothetical protein